MYSLCILIGQEARIVRLFPRLVVKRSDGSEAAVLSKTADFSRRINQLNVASLSGVHTIAIEVSAFRPPTAPYPIGATSSVRLYRLWGE